MTAVRHPMDLKTSGKVSLVIFIVLFVEGLFMNLFIGTEAAGGNPHVERCLLVFHYVMPVLSMAGIVMAAGLIRGRSWARRGMIAALGAWIVFIAAIASLTFAGVLNARPDQFAPGTNRDEALVVTLFVAGAFIFLLSLAIRYLQRAGRTA